MVAADSTNFRVWLASQSERRLDWIKENYSQDGIEVFPIPLIDNEEPEYNSIPVSEQVLLIAESKLKSAYLEIKLGRLDQICEDNLEESSKVITIVSDTLVESPDDPNVALGKPNDSLIAASMLMLLSGSRHNVWSATGIIISSDIKLKNDIPIVKVKLGDSFNGYIFVESSTIEIPSLSDEVLSDLIKSNSWKGKAGAYDLAGEMGNHASLVSGKEVCVLGFASSAMSFLSKLIGA